MKQLRVPHLVATILLCVAFTPIASAQQAKANSDFRVSLVVSAEPLIRDRVLSLMSRELRKLGDVKLTDSNYTYKIEVIAMEQQSQATDRTLGYSLSIVVLYHQTSLPITLTKCSQSDRKFLSDWYDDQLVYRNHFMLTDPDLEQVIIRGAASIDSGTFVPARK